MRKTLFLFSIGGSGQHAIMRWLCRQTEPAMYYNNCEIAGDKPLSNNTVVEFIDGGIINKRFNKFEPKLQIDEYNLIIYNFVNMYVDSWLHINNGVKREQLFSIVVRDHYNLMASRFSKGLKKNLKNIIKVWKNNVKLSINPPSNLIDINYNKWNSSVIYRRALCKRFGISFTDVGFKDVPLIGETRFKDKDYNNRWQHYMNNKQYKDIVRDVALVNLTKQYFGFDINDS